MGVHRFELMPKVMRQRAEQFEKSATHIVRTVAKAADTTLVETTTADTGEARSNWVATVDSPFGGTIPPYAPGKKLGIGETANKFAAQAQFASIALGFKAGRNHTLYISNNVEHIGLLNDGSPTNPPYHMVEQAIQSAQAAAKAQRVFVRIRSR